MHCTNGIAVQRINEGYVDDGVYLPQVQEPVIKRRSFIPVVSKLPTYIPPSKRFNPSLFAKRRAKRKLSQ